MQDQFIRPSSESFKAIRRRLILTQSELGDLLGVSRETVHRWENSQTVPVYAFLAIQQLETVKSKSRLIQSIERFLQSI